MHFIHLADSHLGRASFSKTTEDGSNLRETLIYENFLAGIERICDEQPDALVHAGDLFDTVKPKTKALVVALRALEMLEEAGIPFIAIPGNHDMQKNAYITSVFEVLQKAHPEIHVAYSFRYENFFIKGTMFHCIPNMLHAADYKTASEEAMSWVRNSTYAGLKVQGHVLITHGLATTIRDKRLATCAEFELTPDILLDSYDYIALGHYHGQQQIAPNAWYSGSQEHLTYGEIKDKKGALEVWIENGVTTVDHFSVVRSPMKDLGSINCHHLNHHDIVAEIEEEIGLLDGIGDQMYQITLNFGSDPIVTIPPDSLKKIRDNILDLKIRVRSEETARQQIQQQDLRAINYVDAWNQFMGPDYPMPEAFRDLVRQRGSETLTAAMENHREETV